MKKLLILTSVRTGGGHVSLTEAITEQLDLRDDVEYRVVDGFDLMSPFQRWLLADSYGWITRRAWLIWFWRLAYRAVERNPWMSVRTFQRVCRKKFLALQREFQPDGILAVNPCFIGSVINIMEKAGTEAPMLSMQADLIDIPVAWFDKRTALNVALTDEAYAYSLRKGIAPERLAMGGFPVRRRFYEKVNADVRTTEDGYPRSVLLMGGAEGAGCLVRAARELLERTSSRVTIVCARNKKLREKLERELRARIRRTRAAAGVHQQHGRGNARRRSGRHARQPKQRHGSCCPEPAADYRRRAARTGSAQSARAGEPRTVYLSARSGAPCRNRARTV